MAISCGLRELLPLSGQLSCTSCGIEYDYLSLEGLTASMEIIRDDALFVYFEDRSVNVTQWCSYNLNTEILHICLPFQVIFKCQINVVFR